MAEKPETFNLSGVKERMGTLEENFEKFAEDLETINVYINDNVNAGAGSYIFGEVGRRLWHIWDENAQTFGDFHANFEDWSKMVAIISSNNIEFADIADEIYNNTSKGSSLADIQDNRAEKFYASKSEFNNGSTNSLGGKSYRYYDENGVLVTRYEDADGEAKMIHYTNSEDKITKTVCIDEKGNKSEITYTYDSGSNQPSKKIEYYDLEGKKLSSAPDTFGADGFLNNSGKNVETPTPAPEPEPVVTSKYQTSKEIPSDEKEAAHTIVIPETPELENAYLCSGNAKVIIDSADKVNKNIQSENLLITSFANNLRDDSVYSNLTETQRNEVMEYLLGQRQARMDLSDQIDAAVKNNGAVGKSASSATSSASVNTYKEAVETAETWIDPLNSLATNEQIAAKMAEYGLTFYY